MSNALKIKIYAAVKAAAASGHLTEMQIARQLGEVVTKGEGEKQREVVSIPLTNAIEVMTSKKWLKHLEIKATKTTPRRNVLIPGPVQMPRLPKDEDPTVGQPPLKVWKDPEATIPGRMGKVEPVTPIAIPAAKQKAVAAVAAPPEAVAVLKVEQPSAPPARIVGTPEERAIAAWEQMIDSGDHFAQRHWIYAANLGSRSTMGPRWYGVYDAAKAAVEGFTQGSPMAQFRGVVAEAVAQMPPKFTVTREKKKNQKAGVLPPILEQLRAEAEALDSAIAPARIEAYQAHAALDELLKRKVRVMAAIAALEGDNVSI